MKKKEKKPIIIKATETLHGKRAILTREGEEVAGIVLANDHQITSKNLSFQWKDSDGNKKISAVTTEEYENIAQCLIDW